MIKKEKLDECQTLINLLKEKMKYIILMIHLYVMKKAIMFYYSSDASSFEPTIDFKIEDGRPKIIYGSEWVAKVDSINVEKEIIDRVPKDFFQDIKYLQKIVKNLLN